MLSRTLLFCFILLQTNVFAQDEFYTLTPLSLNDLSAFKAPSKNWKIKANISGGFNDAKSKSELSELYHAAAFFAEQLSSHLERDTVSSRETAAKAREELNSKLKLTRGLLLTLDVEI